MALKRITTDWSERLKLSLDLDLLWTCGAAFSIYSSKSILIDYNYHSPNLLLFGHTILVLCVKILSTYTIGNTSRGMTIWKRCRNDLPTAVFLCIGSISSAVALLTGYQCLIHMPSVTTQLMILSLNLRPEAFFDRVFRAKPDVSALFRYFILLTMATLMMLFDYRIDLNGNLNGQILLLISAACLGIARWCKSYVCCRNEGIGVKYVSGCFGQLSCVLILLMTAARAWTEFGIPTPEPKLQGYIMLFAVNTLVSVTVINIGSSVFQKLPDEGDWSGSGDTIDLARELQRTCNSIALTAVATLLYTFFARKSLISPWQCAAFWIGSFLPYSKTELLYLCGLWTSKNHLLWGYQKAPISTGNYNEIAGSGNPETTFLKRSLSILTVILLIFNWLAILWWSITGQPRNLSVSRRPNLDIVYSPPRSLDLVLARYSEDLSQVFDMLARIISIKRVAERKPKIIIYDKNDESDTPNSKDFEKLVNALPIPLDVEIVQRPNVGREAETFLWHISDRYDDLAAQTLFMQAGLENWRSALARIEQYYVAETGFLSLSYTGQICWDCDHCGDRASWYEHPELIRYLHNLTNPNTPCSPLVRTYKAQFFASAPRIRGVERVKWQEIWTLLNDPNSAVHEKPYLQPWNERIRVDHMSAPILGFTLERLWGDFMQCSEMKIAERCPSLISGLYGWKGELGDCQCLDQSKSVAWS